MDICLLIHLKKVFTNYITHSTNLIYPYFNSNIISSDTVKVDFDFKINGDIKDDELGPIINLIKNITLSGKTQIDYKNKNFVFNLDSKYNNKEMLKFDTYIANEKLYIDLIDVYDKKISFDIEGINNFFEISKYKNDIKILVNESVNTFNNSLKDEYFSLEKVKMAVDGQETAVDKVTLLLNYENASSLVNDILNSLKANDAFLDSYVNIMKLEDEDITKIDVTIIRIISFILCWFHGIGLGIYLLLAILLPEKNEIDN